MPADAQNLVNLCATRGYAKLSHRSLLECIAQGAGGVATPKPPAASFSFAPASGVVVWGDKNGQHTGNLAVFNATADKATTYGLDLSSNSLTSVTGLSSLPLTHLDVGANLLTTLDVTGCTLLSDLSCGNNHITSITGLSTCTALTQLYCGTNLLTTITGLSTCTALTILDCGINSLTTLDISACKGLVNLTCDFNNLTVLAVNTILSTLVSNGHTGGSATISDQTPAAPPSVGPPNGIAAKAALLAETPAWSVITD